MEYLTLKNSDITVSRLCMGGCPLGGYGWGKVQEEKLLEAVHSALEHGITFFDTADTYGLGQSELTLAKGLEGHRQEVVIASKFGVRAGNGKTFYDNSPSYIEEALAGSLKRLNTDYIDLYQVHYRDGITPIGDVIDTLDNMKKEGKIRAYGLSNIHERDREELQYFKGSFVSFQNEYSLACRTHEKDIKTCSKEIDMTPLTWGSLGQGILTGKYNLHNVNFSSDDRRSRDIYVNFHGDKLQKNLNLVELMKPMGEKYDKPISAVAIRFILDYLEDSVVLFGAKSPEQICMNATAADWKLADQDIKILEEGSR